MHVCGWFFLFLVLCFVGFCVRRNTESPDGVVYVRHKLKLTQNQLKIAFLMILNQFWAKFWFFFSFGDLEGPKLRFQGKFNLNILPKVLKNHFLFIFGRIFDFFFAFKALERNEKNFLFHWNQKNLLKTAQNLFFCKFWRKFDFLFFQG